jgi:glycosyltransferase involved in cell wall biosynthesis
VLEAVVHLSAAAVTMTETARSRLFTGFDVDPRKVTTIPHGATLPIGALHRTRAAAPGTTPPTVLTWGLLGPGKGIEHAIDAMALVRRLVPTARYVVAGRTHPKVVARDGESYREMLVRKAHDLGLDGQVGAAGASAEAFAADLVPLAGVPVHLVDERLSTVSAQRSLQEAGRSTRESRGYIDQAAAVVILEGALARERADGTRAGRAVTV